MNNDIKLIGFLTKKANELGIEGFKLWLDCEIARIEDRLDVIYEQSEQLLNDVKKKVEDDT